MKQFYLNSSSRSTNFLSRRLNFIGLFFLFAFVSKSILAQTTLTAGDMAVVRINEDGTGADGFSLVTLVPLESGTIIKITDRGWKGDAFGFIDATETTVTLTTNTDYAAGTLFHFDEETTDQLAVRVNAAATVAYTLTATAFSLSSGDQILVYQGTEANPTFITGIHHGDGGELDTYGTGENDPIGYGNNDPITHWSLENSAVDANANGVAFSRVPKGLTNGVNCISLFYGFYLGASEQEKGNSIYKTDALQSGTKAELMVALNNRANWVSDNTNSTRYARQSYSFSVTAATPTITSATYSASTGVLAVTGTNLEAKTGASNDVDVSKLTLKGEGATTYTLTSSDVEITSATSFSVTLNANDKAAVNLILNKNGLNSTGSTAYNLAAAADWMANFSGGADLTGNGITVSNVAVPSITSATYNVSSGALVVTGTGLLKIAGATNDIVANKFTIKGEGGSTYSLTTTSDVEISSVTSFTLTLSSTDKAGLIGLLNKNGTSSQDATTYNLVASEDWNAGADASVTIADLTGNGITVSNADATAPTVSSVNSNTVNGTYNADDAISIQVNFSEAVIVTGTPQLTLETGTTDRVVNYASGSNSSTLTFTYTVQAGDSSSDLDYKGTSALALNSGSIKDATGNNATLTLASPGVTNSLGNNKAIVIDAIAPTVSDVTSTIANGSYSSGTIIPITINFSESVTVTGTPQLTLETGATDRIVDYTSGSGTNTLTFNYTVQTGDVSADLDYLNTTALTLNSGTIKDGAGNAAVLTLATPGASGSLAANKALAIVIKSPPTITSFSPAKAKPGDVVTITGTNFNTTTNKNVVFFGAAKATVSNATATSLTVTVPIGATYAPITVLNTANNLLAQSSQAFHPVFSPATSGIHSTDFAAKVDFSTGTTPGYMAVGDLDGDGKVDMVVSNQDDNTVSIFLNTSNTGTPSFAAGVIIATGQSPQGVTLGDIDGDGKLDMAIANYNSNSISVYRNTSSLSSINFATMQSIGVGSCPFFVVISDIDGDGRADMTTANKDANTVSVLLNTGAVGDINFGTALELTSISTPYSVTVGDLDGDGKPDIAAAAFGADQISIFRNTGSAGNVSFATAVVFPVDHPYTINIGDLDGDNMPDLITANLYGNNISVFRNLSTSGAISFDTKLDFATGQQVYNVAVGDLDGDGKADLSTSNYTDNTISLLKNTGSSGTISFATPVTVVTANGPDYVVFADIDGDGKSDITVANYSDNTFSVLLNNDNTSSTISGVTSSNLDGTYTIGNVVAIQVNFDEAVTVTGTPQLTLETGATDRVVNYTSGSGTNTLKFSYTVQTGDVSTDLDYLSTTALALNGGTIKDGAGNAAILTLATPGDANSLSANKSLVIDATLPVELNAFNAKLNTSGAVNLTWDTYSELNNDHFEILRSTDGITFKPLTQIKGQGTSPKHEYYNYVDVSPERGNNYYKLVQVDFNGKESDLGIRVVNVDLSEQQEVVVYPNPSSAIAYVKFDSGIYKTAQLTDINGRVLKTQPIHKDAGELSFSLDALSPAIYFIKLNGSERSITKRLIKK